MSRRRHRGPLLTSRGFAFLLLAMTAAFIWGGLFQLIRS